MKTVGICLFFLFSLTAAVNAQHVDSLPTAFACRVLDLEFINLDCGVVLCEDSLEGPKFILYTSDAGSNWDTINVPVASPLDVAFASKSRLFVVDRDVYLSVDLGKNWVKSLEGADWTRAIHFPDVQHGFTETERSTDSGITWITGSLPEPDNKFQIVGSHLHFQDSLHGSYSRSGYWTDDPGLRRDHQLWVTYDGAGTWHQLYEGGPERFPLMGLHLKDSLWLMSFRSGASTRYWDGKRWEPLYTNGATEFVRDSKHAIYASSGMRSTDDGVSFQTWAAIPLQANEDEVIRIVDDTVLFVTTIARNSNSAATRIYRVYINQPPTVNSRVVADTRKFITSAYPNPSNNVFTVEYETNLSGAVTLSVYSVDGVLVREEIVALASAGKPIQLDASGWPSGAYTIVLKSGEAEAKASVIKN